MQIKTNNKLLSKMGILLVSAEKIKAFTEINENVDEALLLSNIQIAEDIALQTLLGTKFLNHIKNAALNNTLTSAETNLLQNYIQPYLIQQAYYESLIAIYMRVMNKSVIVGNSVQGGAISTGDLKYLRNIVRDRAEFYAQRLMDKLKDDQGDYPLYWSQSSNEGMRPSKENYFGGFHIQPGMRKLPPVGMKGYLDPSSDLANPCC